VALLAIQQFTEVGTTPSMVAANASDTVNAVPGLGLIVRNAGGTQDIVTMVVRTLGPGGIATPNVTVTVPITTGERWISLTNPAYIDPTTGLITIQHSFTTSVTQALVRIG
jgi:hypothetical protein